MGSRWRYWLGWAALFLLCWAAASAGVYFYSQFRAPDRGQFLVGLAVLGLGVAVVAPPVMLALLLATRLADEEDWTTEAKNDLERLLEKKSQGLLQQSAHRVRDSAARTSSDSPTAGQFAKTLMVPTPPPPEGLGRLVHLKRRGKWAPPTPEEPQETQPPKRGTSTDIFRKD